VHPGHQASRVSHACGLNGTSCLLLLGEEPIPMDEKQSWLGSHDRIDILLNSSISPRLLIISRPVTGPSDGMYRAKVMWI
jgi:hypothetical protein